MIFVSHSYYGLSVWFPDMIKHLQYEEYEAKVKVRRLTIFCGCVRFL